MNKILFEVSYIGSPQIFCLIAYIILWIILILIDMKRKKKEYLENAGKQKGYKADRIGDVVLLVFSFMVLLALGTTYDSVVLEYKRGNYREVEGRVEDFVKKAHDEEFRVNNVKFEYGIDLMWGYTLTLRKSVITGDGQYLRIRYIPSGGNNEIVYIEEINREAGEKLVMNNILYEASFIGSTKGFFNIALVVISITLMLIYVAKRKYNTNTKMEYFLYRFDCVFFVFWIIVYCFLIIGLILEYGQVILGYKLGEYREVKGVVREYEKQPYREIFTVNGIKFSVSEVEGDWGYVCWKGKSVITGDGQYLRIRYIPSGGSNEIVYIEQIIPEEEIN